MKKNLILAALFCLVAMTTPMNAQLIVCNSGHAEIGVNPSASDGDTITTLKIFGPNGENAAGGRITFGDIPATGFNVMIGEHGNDNSDKLQLHGKLGVYVTQDNVINPNGVLSFFDPSQSTGYNFNTDIISQGLLIQSDERLKEDVAPASRWKKVRHSPFIRQVIDF